MKYQTRLILFSDRPDRILASINTVDYVGSWTAGQDSFAADPPNTLLVLDDVNDTPRYASFSDHVIISCEH